MQMKMESHLFVSYPMENGVALTEQALIVKEEERLDAILYGQIDAMLNRNDQFKLTEKDGRIIW